MTESICLLRRATGHLNFDRVVARVFKTEESAHKWLNNQNQNYDVRVYEDRLKIGDVVTAVMPSRAL